MGCGCPGGANRTVQVLPDSRRANRSGAHPRAAPHGAVRSRGEQEDRPRHGAPQGVESWTRGSLSSSHGEASRRLARAGRPQSWVREGECAGPHRGLRAGQVCRGGTRERGRALCLRDQRPGMGARVPTGPGGSWALRPDHEARGDIPHAEKQARYREASAKRSDPRGAGWQSSRRRVPGKVGK